MNVTLKLNYDLWVKLATYRDDSNVATIRSSAAMKEYIKEKFKGSYTQTIGWGHCDPWGHISFETEEDKTWFLLRWS